MSFSVNTISTDSVAVRSLSAASRQTQVSQVATAGAVRAGNARVESVKPVTRSFGSSEDKIEISPEGRKALEKYYAAKQAQSAAPAAQAANAVSAEALGAQQGKAANAAEQAQSAKPAVAEEAAFKAEQRTQAREQKAPEAEAAETDKIEFRLPGAATPNDGAAPAEAQEPVTTETESVSATELQNMSVSELRTKVTEGTITQAQMDDEISRRQSASEQSEQKSEQIAEASKKVEQTLQSANKAIENLNTFNTTKHYTAVAQALS